MCSSEATLLSISSTSSKDEITLILPELIQYDHLDLLDEALDTIEDEYPKSLLIITGHKNFCLGTSITIVGLSHSNQARFWQRLEKIFHRLEKLNNIKIAIINGNCRGSGSDLILTCDLCLMSDKATIAWDHILNDVSPGMSAWRLPKFIGMGKARELLLSGRKVKACEAYNLGLVQYIYENEEEKKNNIEKICSHIGKISDIILSSTRQLLRETSSQSYENALGTSLAVQSMCIKNHEKKKIYEK